MKQRANAQPAAVRLERVSKRYPAATGDALALDDVTVAAHPGELLVFVGPSGCGKSTLLRAIAGLETLNGGDIFIGDERVNERPPRDRDVAMVFQDYALYPHMSVFDNLAFALRSRGIAGDPLRSRVQAAADLVGVGAQLRRRPLELSGGERQRVALARAIVREPKAFLMDEPLSNLDAQLRVRLRLELAELHRRLGTTMLFVTHDQVEAMTLGDRIVVLREGRVQQIDTPRSLYERPANVFVAAFIGSPPMNLLPHDDGLLLGLRAEQLHVVPAGHQTARLEVIANIAEHLGSQILLHARHAGTPLVVRLPGDAEAPSPGTRLGLTFDASAGVWFDSASGRRLDR